MTAPRPAPPLPFIDRPLAYIFGLILYAMAGLPAVAMIFLQRSPYSGGEGFVLAMFGVAIGAMLVAIARRPKLAAILAFAAGVVAVAKPIVAPIVYQLDAQQVATRALPWDAESHLFYVLTGLAMIAVGGVFAMMHRSERRNAATRLPPISALPPVRQQHYRFAHIFLRDAGLRATPHSATQLIGAAAPAYLERLWADAGAAVEFADKVFPAGLGVSWIGPVGHGWTVVVIRMPMPDRPSEAYAAALAYRQDSAAARYFLLEHGVPQGHQGCWPCLAEWRIDGNRVRHSDVTGYDDAAFLAAIAPALEINRF